MFELNVLNSVWTQIDQKTAIHLNTYLSFTKTNWGARQGKNGAPSYETVRMIESRGDGTFIFPTGLLNKAILACEDYGKKYKITGWSPVIEYDSPYIDGIDFRDYQKRLIKAGLKYLRGVLKAPTATGKSIIILGLISAFSQENILFLCHTKDLVDQMKEHLENNGFEDIGMWTGDKKEMKRITVATVQSYAKIASKHVDHWDVILIDEGHRVSNITGNYAKALSYSAAPVKIAFTATMPYLPEAKMALEAFVGPLLAEYTIEEANKDGWISKATIFVETVGKIPHDILTDASELKTDKKRPSEYQILYWNGIVKNVARNLRILNRADKLRKQSKSVLITVNLTSHGEELLKLLKDHYDFDIVFAHGKTKNRRELLNRFKNKDFKVLMATKVFDEGIDIPSLNACINGGGGKSEIATLQKIGRTLRLDGITNTVELYDFQDTCHGILETHFRKRLNMYKQNKWDIKFLSEKRRSEKKKTKKSAKRSLFKKIA